MLAGLMSQWRMPRECANASASANRPPSRHTACAKSSLASASRSRSAAGSKPESPRRAASSAASSDRPEFRHAAVAVDVADDDAEVRAGYVLEAQPVHPGFGVGERREHLHDVVVFQPGQQLPLAPVAVLAADHLQRDVAPSDTWRARNTCPNEPSPVWRRSRTRRRAAGSAIRERWSTPRPGDGIVPS